MPQSYIESLVQYAKAPELELGPFDINGSEIMAPKQWSHSAVRIATSRWLRGRKGTDSHETSIRQMHRRVAAALAYHAQETRDLSVDATLQLERVLVSMQQTQRMAFNTPVYLNVAWSNNPRCSACFHFVCGFIRPVVCAGQLFSIQTPSGQNA